MRWPFFHVVARKEIRRSHFNTFLCQMVLLSMSCPCSWGLVPDGGVAAFIPDFLNLHWLAHLKILEMGHFFGKVLPSYTFLCQMVLCCCPCLALALEFCLLFTFICWGFSIGTNYDLRIIYIFARILLMSLFLYLLALLLHWFLIFQIWVVTPQDLRKCSCATWWCC